MVLRDFNEKNQDPRLSILKVMHEVVFCLCSQWLQGMVLDGIKGFQAKKSNSMTFNYKSVLRYLVLAQVFYMLVLHIPVLSLIEPNQ